MFNKSLFKIKKKNPFPFVKVREVVGVEFSGLIGQQDESKNIILLYNHHPFLIERKAFRNIPFMPDTRRVEQIYWLPRHRDRPTSMMDRKDSLHM